MQKLFNGSMLKFSGINSSWSGNISIVEKMHLRMGRNARKPVFRGLRTAQAQTSLRIRTV